MTLAAPRPSAPMPAAPQSSRLASVPVLASSAALPAVETPPLAPTAAPVTVTLAVTVLPEVFPTPEIEYVPASLMLTGNEKFPLASAVVAKLCGARGRLILAGTAMLAPPEKALPAACGARVRVTVTVTVSPARKPEPENVKVSPGATVPSETVPEVVGAGYVAIAGTAPTNAMDPASAIVASDFFMCPLETVKTNVTLCGDFRSPDRRLKSHY
jgi:hypothetical protein